MSQSLSEVTNKLSELTDVSDKACITKLLNRMSKSHTLAHVFMRMVIGNNYKVDHNELKQFIKNTKNRMNHKDIDEQDKDIDDMGPLEDIDERDKDVDDMVRLENIGRMSKTECKESGNRFRKYRCDVAKNNDSTCGMNTNFQCQKGSLIGTQLCTMSDTGRCKLTTEAAKHGLREYHRKQVYEATKTLRQRYLNAHS